MQGKRKKQLKFNKIKLNKVLKFSQYFKFKFKIKSNRKKKRNKLLNKA